MPRIARYLNLTPGSANALAAAFCGCAVAAVAIRVIADIQVSIAGAPFSTEKIASSIVSAMLWFSALGGLFFGWLSDHVGRKRTLLITTALLLHPFFCAAWRGTTPCF
jgi:MFS family permease